MIRFPCPLPTLLDFHKSEKKNCTVYGEKPLDESMKTANLCVMSYQKVQHGT